MNKLLLHPHTFPFSLVLPLAISMLLFSCGDDEKSVTPSPVTGASFHQVFSLPTVTTWEKVWGVSASDLFVMGDSGLVYRGDGTTWSEELSRRGSDRVMYSAWGEAADNAYFVGKVIAGDTVWVYDSDGDSTAVPQDSPVLHWYNGTVFDGVFLTDVQWGLYDIWGSAADDIFAVGYDGTIIHYNGADWSVMTGGGDSPVRLNSVWGTSDSSVYAAGSSGALLRYDGSGWSVITTRTGEDIWDVWGLNDTAIYCAGSGGLILHYNGSDLTRMSTPVTNSLYSIWGEAEDDLYTVGWGGTILHYDGAGWVETEKITKFGLLSIWGTGGAGDIYAVGQTALRYDGSEWNPVPVRNEPDFTDVWAGSSADIEEIIAVGSGGTVLKSTGGDYFSSMTVDAGTISSDLNGVAGYADTALFIVGDGGTILQRDESDNSNWLDVSPGLTADLQAVAVLSNDLAYAVGTGGIVVEYDGDSWTELAGLVGQTLNDVWLSDAGGDTVIHIVGDNGTALYYNSSWQVVTSGSTENLQSVFGIGGGEAYAVGDNGTLLHFASGSWSVISSGTAENLTALWADVSGDVFVGGDQGRVFKLENGSLSEIETNTGFDLSGLYGLGGDDFFVVGEFNHILHYRR